MRPMRRRPHFPWLATALLLAWGLSAGRAAAEVRLAGTPDRVVLQTHDATMPEILAALRSAFDLEVRLKGSTGRTFTGVYSGSVRRVLARLLRGEDYVIGSDRDGMRIVLLGASASDRNAARSDPLAGVQGSRLVALRQMRGTGGLRGRVIADEP
jgi:hypothetical protein